MSKLKLKKYIPKNAGGGNKGLKTALNLASLVGGAINPAIGVGISGINSMIPDEVEMQNTMPVTNNINPYGKFEFGGHLRGFEQYNAESHSQGGQGINSEGVPTNVNPSAEIEKKENKLKYFNLPDKQGQQYIFSDANGTAKQMKNIINKYKDANPTLDNATRTAIEFEAKELEGKNERMNVQKTIQQYMCGGKYEYGGKMPDGGPFNPYTAGAVYVANLYKDIPGLSNLNAPMDRANLNVTTPINSAEATPLSTDDTAGIPAPQSRNLNINAEDILGGLGYAVKAGQALQKPVEDKLILPNYQESDQRFNKMNANLAGARQSVQGVSNALSEMNRGAASSYSEYRNRELGNLSQLQDKLSNIGLEEQGLRNQILGTQGQYELNKAMTNRNIRQEQQVANLQNEARTKDIRASFANDILGEADRLAANRNNKDIANATLTETMEILKTLYPDFAPNEEFAKALQDYSRGKITEEQFNKVKENQTIIKYNG